MSINEKFALLYGLNKTDNIDRCIDETYFVTESITKKESILYRDKDDIYDFDYSEWDPMNNTVQFLLVLNKFQKASDFYIEAITKTGNFNTENELQKILIDFFILKYWKN